MSPRVPLLVRMMRLKVVVTLWTFLLIGLARHTAGPDPAHLGLALLALGAGYAVATTANDISDEAIDRVNRPRDAGRPLVIGDASVADLWKTNALAASVAVIAAIPLGTPALVIVAISLMVSYAYSVHPIRLSHRWVLAPIALSVAYVVLPYGLGVVIARDRWSDGDLALVLGLSVLFFARIVVKDFRDRLGDRRFGKPTPLLRLGKRTTCAVSMVGAAIGTSIVIIAVGPSPPLAAMFVLCGIGVEWMLFRLARAHDERVEQVSIGIAARAGNGLLLSTLTVLLLRGSGADAWTTSMIVGCLVTVFAASFLDAALHPQQVRIGYKA